MSDPWNLACFVAGRVVALLFVQVVCRKRAIELSLGIYVSRVPSADNIADDPSRQDYKILQKIRAVWIEPMLSAQFKNAQSRRALSLNSKERPGPLRACVQEPC